MSSNLWCRQPRESPKAYLAFCLYRDAGPGRSLRNLVQVQATFFRLAPLVLG